MNATPPLALTTLEGRFWGRVTAGLGHEMNNVLATVDGLAGLQEDLLSLATGAEENSARIADAAARIGKQVQRGRTLTILLRSLGHSVDDDAGSLHLDHRVEEAMLLCRRFADQGGVDLVREGATTGATPRGRAFDLVHVTCRCIFTALAGAESGETVAVGADSGAAGIRITTTGGRQEPPSAEFAEELALLSRLVEILDGTLEVRRTEDHSLDLIVDMPPTRGYGSAGRNG